MKYSRQLLKGYSGPIRKMLEEELHISPESHHRHLRRKKKRHASHKKHAIERRRHHHMAKAKLGSGGRFAAFKRRLESQGKSADEAGAIAASAGRKKYGTSKMAKLSAMGRRKAAANDHDGDE